MTTPSRGQFPRSNVTGARPASLHPGSFAVNWRDKVIWVGDQSGNAIRFSRKVENYNQALAYAPDDFVIIGPDIWRAIATIPAGSPFNQVLWQRMTNSGRAEIAEPYASEIYSGGVVTRLTITSVSITAGQGIVVNNTTPAQVLSTPVSWSTFTAVLAPLTTPWTVIGLNSAAALVHISTDEFDAAWRRQHITLATVLWSNAGTILAVHDASIRAAGDSESLRDGYFVNGGAYRANGARIKAIEDTLALEHSAGEIFNLGGRWRTDPLSPNLLSVARNGFLIIPATATAVSGPEATQVQTTLYDPAGAGATVPVPIGKFTIQYLFSTPDMTAFFLQKGQTAYDSQFDAIAAITDDYAGYKLFAPGVALMLLAAVIAEQGSANLNGAAILNASPVGDPFASAGAAAVAGSDFYLLDGSRPLMGDMDANGFEIIDAVLDGGTF